MTRLVDRQLGVLWATDGSSASHAALPLLRELLLPRTGRLAVLTVVPHLIIGGARPDPGFLARATPAARRTAAAEALETAQRDATLLDPPPGLAVEVLARWGHPVEEVLRAARSQTDLVVMGAKGHSNLGLMLLGSVAQGVVQHTNRPVLIARPRSSRDGVSLRTVLVGYDGSAEARRAVSFLRRLHLAATTRVILVAVVQPFHLPPHLPAGERRQATDAAHAVNAQRHRSADRLLASLARRSEGVWAVETRVISDESAAGALDRAARESDADLLVVGSRKPAPPGTYIGGSTAEKLVRHAQTSLLVVR